MIISKISKTFTLILASFQFFLTANAQTTSQTFKPSTGTIGAISDTCGIFKIQGCKDVFEIIFGSLVPSLYIVIFALSAIFFLVGAIKLVTSAGSPEQVKSAWSQIQSNFVGLVVLLLAVTIFFVVISLVGIGFEYASDITNIAK